MTMNLEVLDRYARLLGMRHPSVALAFEHIADKKSRETLPPPYHSACARFEFEVCDPETPEDQVCGAITYIDEHDRCPSCWLSGWYRECFDGECRCSPDLPPCWPFCSF